MGYKRSANVYRLKFDGTDFDGLEVVAKGLPVGQLLDLSSAVAAGSNESAATVLSIFANRLVEWNIEDDDDVPVPATLDGVRTLDLDFVMQIIASWMEAMSGVSSTLGKGLNSGSRYPEASLPMESQ